MENQRKILIIDDEPDILEFLSYNFRKQQFEVSVANNGLEGIEKINSDKPEVIISDILMPKMDGIEMCKEIRKKKEFSLTPFIFLTAVSDDYKVLYAMSSGADQFASKPIRFEYLLRMVNDLLEPNN
jgi:two-component system alkaline phosphatase synthesis response regulator PhoP